MSTKKWNHGSVWRRWDPHLHTPGTLRNDQFRGDWDGYISRIETAIPKVEALGITDYFSTRSYKEVLRRKDAGSLSSVPLIFPNVEMRLTVETRDGSGINIHLLVSPDDPDHISKLDQRLGRLLFKFRDVQYQCTDDGLTALGRIHAGDASLDQVAAMKVGANQFKVEFGKLSELFRDDAWLRDNSLVAIDGGHDGLGGLSQDASFAGLREELGRFAQIIFSSKSSDRNYWLGKHPDFRATGHSPKPCLHGSDAHSLDKVLLPDLDRLCWIRGNATFETLRQALSEPERRVHIGSIPPPGPTPGNTIRKVIFKNAPWITNGTVELNEGLVSIIGSKGSGKTALADLVAFGVGAQDGEPSDASFLRKAAPLLGSLEVQVEWGDGEITKSGFAGDQYVGEPRARYLSQQFVEQLCGSNDLSDSLVLEIKRVVFNAIPIEDRYGTSDFEELANIKLHGSRSEREAQKSATKAANQDVATEEKLIGSATTLTNKAADAKRQRELLEIAIKDIPATGKDAQAAALTRKQEWIRILQSNIANREKKAQQLKDLKVELARVMDFANGTIAEIRRKNPNLLTDPQWDGLRPVIDPAQISMLDALISSNTADIATMRENGVMIPNPDDAQSPMIATGGLKALAQEEDRLKAALGLDQANALRRGDLERKLGLAKVAETKATEEVTYAAGAAERKKLAFVRRSERYADIFSSLTSEETTLKALYEPLMRRCADHPKLMKFTVTVQRSVNLDSWALQGEELFDLRKTIFKRGDIAKLATKMLAPSWRTGSPADVLEAIRKFVELCGKNMVDGLLSDKTRTQLGEWIYRTDHIGVQYGIQYEGVDIERLSPGTRGVVLLTLYLALDDSDARPLIIDQPEENLDPRSVYEDLMPFFREAAKRRQIIMVTHNANLVVNSDSDQVVVAAATRTGPGSLPHFLYEGGGLEIPWVRDDVCSILEGGDTAFRMRGQRYGV